MNHYYEPTVSLKTSGLFDTVQTILHIRQYNPDTKAFYDARHRRPVRDEIFIAMMAPKTEAP